MFAAYVSVGTRLRSRVLALLAYDRCVCNVKWRVAERDRRKRGGGEGEA